MTGPDASRDDRRDDQDLGFSPELAAQLRSALAQEVDTMTATPDLFVRVRERRSRRRWTTALGWTAGLTAAAVAGVLVLGQLPQPAPQPPVIGQDSDEEPGDTTPEPSPTASADTEEPTTDADGATGALPEGTVELADGLVVPATELAVEPGVGLVLATREADGIVTTSTVLDRVGGTELSTVDVRALAVRPGSTPSDWTAVLAFSDPVPDAPVSTWMVRVQGPDVVDEAELGVPIELAPTFVWAPDGSAVAVSSIGFGTRVVAVPDVNDDPLATVETQPVEDLAGVDQWVPTDDPATVGAEFELWGGGPGETGIIVVPGVLSADGTVDLGPASFDAPYEVAEGGLTARAYLLADGRFLEVGLDDGRARWVLSLRTRDDVVITTTPVPLPQDDWWPARGTVALSDVGEGTALRIPFTDGTQLRPVIVAADGDELVVAAPADVPVTPSDWHD